MQLGTVPQHDILLGTYRRVDGQHFELTARLFEFPAEPSMTTDRLAVRL